jgi:predicted SAM-dependent methyltransferase
MRQLAFELRVARLHRAGARQAARLRTDGTLLRLNLACGYRLKESWINVDLFAPLADLHLDLRRRLPFPDNSARDIYIEHFFEHLEYPNVADSMAWELEARERRSEALQFLSECKRVLAPGGIVDIVVPDAEGMIGVYVTRRERSEPEVPWWGPPWCDTEMHRVNYLFRQGREHKYAYDEETLSRILRSAGYCDIQRRPYDPAMDAPNHVIGSLCMTAQKPAAVAERVPRAEQWELARSDTPAA